MLDAEVRVDMPSLERLFTDDFVRMTLAGFETKPNFLNNLKTGRNRFKAYDLSDVQIHIHGNIAVIAGGLHLVSANGDTQNMFGDIWVERNGTWQMSGWVTSRPAPAGRITPGDTPMKKLDVAGLDAAQMTLLKRNEEFFSAHTRVDTAALDSLVTSDFFRLNDEGIVNRAKFFDDLKTSKTRFAILEPGEVKVQVYGNSAMLTGLFRRKDAASDTQNGFMSAWVLQKGKWRAVAWIEDAHPQPNAPAAR
jgi:hypothetical protein